MRANDTSGLQVIKKEDKERRVSAFIRAHLVSRKRLGITGPKEYLLVARSSESPVCRALSAMMPALTEAGITIRVVLTAADTGVFGSDQGASSALLEAATTRVISDARLYEAHEQLVVDNEICWIGDCMRREPAKCDAFEAYLTNDGKAAKAAALTFSHLWQMSKPSAPPARMMPSIGYKDAHAPGVISQSLTESEKSAPTVLTRH